MSGRVKIKSVKKTLGNKDIQEVFRNALGGEGAALDYDTAWPKFKRVKYHVERGIKVLDWLTHRSWLSAEFTAEVLAIKEYAATLQAEFAQEFGSVPDLDEFVDPLIRQALGGGEVFSICPNFDQVPPELLAQFKEKYEVAMKSDLINTLVVTCKELTTYKAFIENREALNGQFLMRAGLTFAPIPKLPAANFKAFYQSGSLSENQREIIMIFLHQLYTVTHEVYEAASAPDINVDEFIEVVMTSIEEVKKFIPRCDEAFSKLVQSVELLKSNFGGYYRDMRNSGNPTLLMENFVLDVAKESEGGSAKLKFQFRKIISHYRKMAQSQPRDAQTQALFNELDSSFKELEKREAAVSDEAAQPEATGVDADATSLDATAPDATEEWEPVADTRTKEEKIRARRSRAKVRRTASKSLARHMEQALPPLPATSTPSGLMLSLENTVEAPPSTDAGKASTDADEASTDAGEVSTDAGEPPEEN